MRKLTLNTKLKDLTKGEREILTEILAIAKLPRRLAAQIERALEQNTLPIPELSVRLKREHPELSFDFDDQSVIESALSQVRLYYTLDSIIGDRCPECEGTGHTPCRVCRGHGSLRPPSHENDDVTLEMLLLAGVFSRSGRVAQK